MAAAGILAGGSFNTSQATGLGKNFVHHVYFWLKKPVTPEGIARFEKGLKALVAIDFIVDYHLGIPAGTSREVVDGSYSYSLLVIFKNRADQDSYQPHPTHQKFIADCSDLWEKVVVYDSVSI
jgi:hypothetical protein